MQAVRLVARAFVYGTEDEARVTAALLRVVGRASDPDAQGRVTRSRIKGHYGTDILLLEFVVNNPKELRRTFEAWRTNEALVATLRDEFEARMDDDTVLHFRLDKQEAVEGRLELGAGGDAFTFEVKYAQHGPSDTAQDFPFR